MWACGPGRARPGRAFFRPGTFPHPPPLSTLVNCVSLHHHHRHRHAAHNTHPSANTAATPACGGYTRCCSSDLPCSAYAAPFSCPSHRLPAPPCLAAYLLVHKHLQHQVRPFPSFHLDCTNPRHCPHSKLSDREYHNLSDGTLDSLLETFEILLEESPSASDWDIEFAVSTILLQLCLLPAFSPLLPFSAVGRT